MQWEITADPTITPVGSVPPTHRPASSSSYGGGADPGARPAVTARSFDQIACPAAAASPPARRPAAGPRAAYR